MRLLDRLFRRNPGERPRVTFDAEGVVRTLPDGRSESVRWGELQEVSILTTDEGPYGDDVIWMLRGTGGGCAVPSETDGVTGLLARLQQLPGFDNGAVIRAMGSTDAAEFVCWRRAP